MADLIIERHLAIAITYDDWTIGSESEQRMWERFRDNNRIGCIYALSDEPHWAQCDITRKWGDCYVFSYDTETLDV